MSILRLAAQLTLDGSRFKAGLKEAQVASGKFSSDVSRDIKGQLAGAFGIGALAYGIKRLIDFNSQIKDTADALDISTKALQEQNYWVTQNGGTLSDLTNSYRGLARARMDALGGNADKMGIFEALGIDQATLATQKLEATFAQAAEAFRTTDFGADKIAAVMEIFGRGGTAILPALNAELGEFAQRAHDTGQVIGEGINAKLEEMGDILDELAGKARFFGSGAIVGAIKGIDLAVTSLGMGVLGIGQLGLKLADVTLANIGKISAALGLGGFEGLRGMISEQSALYGSAANDMFESMLDRYDPVKLAERNSKAKGAALFSDYESPSEKTARDAIDRLTFDRIDLPNIPASEVSSLTRSGQLSGRSFAYSNKEAEKELEIARQTLRVEQEQLQALRNIERQKGKTLRVNP